MHIIFFPFLFINTIHRNLRFNRCTALNCQNSVISVKAEALRCCYLCGDLSGIPWPSAYSKTIRVPTTSDYRRQKQQCVYVRRSSG